MVLLEFYEQKTCFTLISHGTRMFCLRYKTFYWSVYEDNKCLCLSVFTQNIPLSKLDHKTDCTKAFKRRKLLLSPITGSIKN